MKTSVTASLMRRINRSAILELIREEGPLSRSKIARRLDVSLPTVMRIVDELMEEGLVSKGGYSESTGGRPPSLVTFNGESYAVVGVDLGEDKMFGMVADLAGNVQHTQFMDPENDHGPDTYVDQLCDLIAKLLAVSRPEGQEIRGIGIGVPGVTLVPEGVVTWAPSLGWRDLPLQKLLSERFPKVPVFVENDVNLAALGELGFGAGRGVQNLVSLTVSKGIGAGLIVGGMLYRGQHQGAGEVCNMVPGVRFLGERYEEFGALETIASTSGIVRRARELLTRENLPLPEADVTADVVFAAAREGEKWAVQVVDETVDYLSIAVANLAATLDPEVVVLGGTISRDADLLIDPILTRVEGLVPFVPELVASPLERRAVIMGAIMLVLNLTTGYFAVKKLP